MKTSNLYEIKNRYPERKWPLYDAFCRQCDHVSKAWDYRRNALKDIRDHLRTEHHIVPGVSVHMSSGDWGTAVLVFGTKDVDLARELADYELAHSWGEDPDDVPSLLEGEPLVKRGNIVPPFGYFMDEGYSWIWVDSDKGRSEALVWEW